MADGENRDETRRHTQQACPLEVWNFLGGFPSVFRAHSRTSFHPLPSLKCGPPLPRACPRHFVRLCSFSAQEAEAEQDVGESGEVVEGDREGRQGSVCRLCCHNSGTF